MAVVGTERHFQIGSALFFSSFLFQQQRLHHTVHIHVSFEVVGFVEVAFFIALRGAEVDEVNAVAEALDHAHQVIISPYAVASRAETQAIG